MRMRMGVVLAASAVLTAAGGLSAGAASAQTAPNPGALTHAASSHAAPAQAAPAQAAPAQVVPAQVVSAQVVSAGSVRAQASCVGPASPDGGALACFNPTGEHIYNCDTGPDHHPVVHYYRSTSPNTRRTLSDTPGNGNCVDHNLANIPESGWVDIQSCNYEGSTTLSCSGYVRVSANG